MEPIESRRAKEISSKVMVEALICLDVVREGRIHDLSWRSDPVDDDTFETLGVIRPGTGDTFLNLAKNEYETYRRL